MKLLTSSRFYRRISGNVVKVRDSIWKKRRLAAPPSMLVPEEKTVLFDSDDFFHRAYDEGLERSGTPDRGPRRRSRFFNLMQALESTTGLPGGAVECGCWRGLSSFLTCEYLRRENALFRGYGFTVIDSFEGLSEPGLEDSIERDIIRGGKARKGKPFKGSGAYAASMDHVRGVLGEFPDVELVKGWIPQVLATLPEREYRFVHVDLDLYAPILEAFRYFYPRLLRGGVLVSDDYGSLFWPGAKRAVEEFCQESGARLLASVTGQAIVMKL